MQARISLPRKLLLCVSLLVVLASVGLYPIAYQKYSLYSAERSLIQRDANAAIGWLRGVPDGNTKGQKEFLMARAYRRLGEMELVRTQIQRAYEHGFSVERLQREQWLAMAQSGQMRDAEPYLKQLLQDPGNDGAEICESFVSGYFRNRQVWKAMPIIEAWQADFPSDPLPYAIKAGRFREMESWKDAVLAYQQVLKLSPEDTDIRLNLAICLKSSLRMEEAEVEFRKCLSETPQNETLLAEWGDFLLAVGKSREANLVFEQLLKIAPHNFDARAAKGRILIANGQSLEAVKVLRPLNQERPFDLKVQYSLASAFKDAGMSVEASEMFERYNETKTQLQRKKRLLDELDSTADPVAVRFEIASIAMRHEPPEEGLRWMMSVIDSDPKHQAAYQAIAEHYRRAGNIDLEAKYLEMARQCVAPELEP